MCAIVDNDMRDRFFRSPVDPALRSLWKWIDDRKGVLVVGGTLRAELYGSTNARRTIQEWIRTKRAQDLDENSPGKVDAETRAITSSGLCKSNDKHVIALARVSGARILCSGDKSLHEDFGNPELINHPRGRIYQNCTHKHLLAHEGGCPMQAPTANTRPTSRRRKRR